MGMPRLNLDTKDTQVHVHQLASELADGSSCPDQAVVQWCFQHTAKAEWTFTSDSCTHSLPAISVGKPCGVGPQSTNPSLPQFRFPWYRATSLFAHQIISLCAVWGAAVQPTTSFCFCEMDSYEEDSLSLDGLEVTLPAAVRGIRDPAPGPRP